MLQNPPKFCGRNGKALVHYQGPKEALQRETGPCSLQLLAKTQGKNPLSPSLQRTLIYNRGNAPRYFSCHSTVCPGSRTAGFKCWGSKCPKSFHTDSSPTLPTNKGIIFPLTVFLILNSCSIWSFAGLTNRKHSLDKRGPFWSFLLPCTPGIGL